MNNGHRRLSSTDRERVLLINPPVYDTRLHWAQWQQPTRLLRLGSFLRRSGAEVRLIDSLYNPSQQLLKRKRVALLDIEGLLIPKWRFGRPTSVIASDLTALKKAEWRPDKVYVECFTTFWWEGAAEVIQAVKRAFPNTRVVLLGAYPEYCPEHATKHTAADEIRTAPWPEISREPADLSLYSTPPSFAYLTLGHGTRSVDEILEEVTAAVAEDIGQFAFADEAIAARHGDLYCTVLEELAARSLNVKLFALGNIGASDLAREPALARLMKAAGYAQIWLSDDRATPIRATVDDQLVDDYEQAAERCHRAGYTQRTGVVVASVCLGRRGEDLEERARLATLAAHHIGSVIMWAYQPAPEECPEVSLEEQNGKLFPLREASGYSYRDYLDVLGLAVVLNAKHRDKTFDFLGEGLIPCLFRESIGRRAWDPDPDVKGPILLPVRMR